MNSVAQRYNFVQQIGKGSFSEIYLIEDQKKGKKYALKHIAKKSYSTCQECQILLQIQKHPHKNLIGLKEIHEDEKDILIVLEYVENGSLLNYLSDKHDLSEKKIRKFFTGILDGLQHLHERLGVVHRDIKLENILVTEHEEAKLVDFNLSFFWNPEELQTKYCGTVVYCAPEIVSGIPYYGPAQDIWSLGVVLYFLLFNSFPFTSEQRDKRAKRRSIMKHIAACEYSIPTSRRVSPEVIDLLTSILQLDSAKRPTISEIKKHPWFKLSLKEKDSCTERSEIEEASTVFVGTDSVSDEVDNAPQSNDSSQINGVNNTSYEVKKKRKSHNIFRRLVEKFSLLKTKSS
eukprot:TRINITY_DN3257_c0_g1_i1.p1 TRINITY_DN3257_c0_g1~~TRINITY_DN3257_c0_g1_i1.p1  ORF type:complete len:346 (-),score=60.97 TRINITY_DN3257_c0_g1_i1:45-1082(-)